MTPSGVNVRAGGFFKESYSPDQLLTRNVDLAVTIRVTFAALAAILKRGSLVGLSKPDTVPNTGTADTGNTGNGTMTGVADGGSGLKNGVYRAVARTAGATARFELFDPDGEYVGEITTGTAFTSRHLNLTINDGSDDFAVGDEFTIECTGGTYKLSEADANDGSQNPRAIVVEDMPINAEKQSGLVYIRGDFNATAMTFGDGHDADSVRDRLQARGIAIETAIESEGV